MQLLDLGQCRNNDIGRNNKYNMLLHRTKDTCLKLRIQKSSISLFFTEYNI